MHDDGFAMRIWQIIGSSTRLATACTSRINGPMQAASSVCVLVDRQTDGTLQGSNGAVAVGTCPGDACLNLSALGFIGGGGCLCDGAALAAAHREATHARRELVFTLIGARRPARCTLVLLRITLPSIMLVMAAVKWLHHRALLTMQPCSCRPLTFSADGCQSPPASAALGTTAVHRAQAHAHERC